MTIVFVGAATAAETGFQGTPIALTLDAGAAADRCVIVIAWGSSSLPNSITGATYNGVAMTGLTEQAWGTDDNTRLFYLVGAAAGANSLSVAYSGDISAINILALAYSGVGAVSGGTWKPEGSSSANPFVTISSAVGETATAVFITDGSGVRGTSTNERYDADMTGVSYAFYACDEPGATPTVDVDYTPASAQFYFGWGLSMAQAVAALIAQEDDITLKRRNRPGRGPYSRGRYFRPVGETAPTSRQGVVAGTLADATLSSAGTLAVAGAASVTLDAATVSSAATLALAGATSTNLAAATLSSAGTVALAGATSATLADATLSSAGTAALAGAASVVLAAATLSSAGTLALAGTTSATLADATLSADSVISADGTGSLAITLDAAALSSAATLALAAAASMALGAATVSSTGTAALVGSASITLADCTIVAEGINPGASGGASAAAIWAYVIPGSGGMTAADLLLGAYAKSDELWREHGLDILAPLVVSQTVRGAGPLQQQSINEAGGTVTVQRLP